MLAAVSSPDPDPGIELAATTARVSTIDGRWAYADVSGTYRGEQLQGARYVLRRADPTVLAWNVATVGSSLGGCRFMRGLGMSAAVVDDLSVSHEISYSCVNPPPTAVPCLVSRPGAWFSVARRKPQRCDLSLSGDDQPANPWFMRLRALKWIRIGDDEAVAVGAIIGTTLRSPRPRSACSFAAGGRRTAARSSPGPSSRLGTADAQDHSASVDAPGHPKTADIHRWSRAARGKASPWRSRAAAALDGQERASPQRWPAPARAPGLARDRRAVAAGPGLHGPTSVSWTRWGNP